MTYHDDFYRPITQYTIPYATWDEPDIIPAAPGDDDLRRAIRDAMDRKPNHGPSRIKADLQFHYGYPDVPLAVILGVKAGM